MYKEVFGVFGDRDAFRRFGPERSYDAVVSGDHVTVGVRDPYLGLPGRTSVHDGPDGQCVVWGEAYHPGETTSAAAWLYDAFADRGRDAFDALNGSYIVVLERDDDAVVVTDPVRSWECFYTDAPGVRVFGSDAATVGWTVDSPRVCRRALLEFLHLSVVFGERTLLDRVSRVPFDSCLGPASVTPLDRFTYEPSPASFDYAGELARRLRRAVGRRTGLPGRTGLLLSAGYDSRVLLSELSGVDQCYTLGDPDDDEVRCARRVAEQYGCDHVTLSPTSQYLVADQDKARYGQGIKESLHVHHASRTDEIDLDTVFHGLLWDTLFRGHFLEPSTVGAAGVEVPIGGLDPDPDPVDALLDRLGYLPEGSRLLTDYASVGPADHESFVRDAVGDALDDVRDRADRTQNLIDACGVTNQPTVPFRTHLADNFLESFVAVDAELLDWHLRTPPAYRSTETFLAAARKLDDDILRHRPPDRPHDSQLLNGVVGFLRRKLPWFQPFDTSWPSRTTNFERYGLDHRLFPDRAYLHELMPRHKLRLADVEQWLEHCLDADIDTAAELDAGLRSG